MKRETTIIFFLTALLLSGCGGAKRAKEKAEREAASQSDKPEIEGEIDGAEKEEPSLTPVPIDYVAAYIVEFAPIAQEEMLQYGIPASITMAQAILESGAGRGELTRKAKNHFGIKCHDWKGDSVYHDDDERGECFRKYTDARNSFRDHSLFLSGRKRYMDLFKLDRDDYKSWARGLRKAGYATDRRYPEKLIALIERHKLYVYDAEVLGERPKNYKSVSEKIERHTVKKGETLYSISRRYNLKVRELMQYNGLIDSNIHVGQVLTIKPLD